jgi:serine/threonine protein kinase
MPHINLLQLEEVGIDDTSVHIVTKPFSGGTLANLISRKGKGSFQKCEIQYILDQLLQGTIIS